jgi:hypothetical protein
MGRCVHIVSIAGALALALAAQGCAFQSKEQEERAEHMRVHCATAEGDLRVLRSEKAHVVERLAMGASAIHPASAVVGLLTGTEGTKLEVATGEYNHELDAKIAEIQRTCGVE